MPDESCRKCGGKLSNCALCFECRQPTQQICSKCGNMTEMRFHSSCFYYLEFICTQIDASLEKGMPQNDNYDQIISL